MQGMEIFGVEIDVVQIVRVLLKLGLLIVLYMIARPIGRKVIEGSIARLTKDKKTSAARVKTLDKLLVNVYSYILLFVFSLMFFAALGIDIGPLILGAGVLGLAIGFGAQGLVSDVVTGFFILVERQLEIDDYVTTAGYDGVVEEVGLRTTKIRSFDGTLNFVPNRFIEGVANHSRGNMRALVDIGISYEDNINDALGILNDVCAQFTTDERFKESPQAIGVQAFDTQEVVLRVIGQTENGLQWACERDLREQIKGAFDQAQMVLPSSRDLVVTKK